MLELIQIILLNLIVSFDNVGVIALATQKLSAKKARSAQRIGIGLSIVLKLLFILIVESLFSVHWLHIRIIGGLLLLYVTYTMMKPHKSESDNVKITKYGDEKFILVIIYIIAADVGMSLDNVIAILSIVSENTGILSINDMIMIVFALVICIPVLLYFSETATIMMERYTILTHICAGYLVYIATKMIFEDEIFDMLSHYSVSISMLLGILTFLIGFVDTRKIKG